MSCWLNLTVHCHFCQYRQFSFDDKSVSSTPTGDETMTIQTDLLGAIDTYFDAIHHCDTE
ncbi:MAG: hypothetical protein ACI80I_001506, partial [Akkermansiaceae bacterium]